jgi:ribosome-binding factor A
MNTIAHKKIEKNLFNIVSKIISEDVNDSKVSFPSVTGVSLSRDKSHLKIYLTFTAYPKQSLDALQKAKGFIRSELSQYTNMRKVPQIYLLEDTT